MKPIRVLTVVAIAVLAVWVGVWALGDNAKSSGPNAAALPEGSEPPEPIKPPAPVAPEPPPPPSSPPPAPPAEPSATPSAAVKPTSPVALSERDIMEQLRELGSSNPTRSLELAREGNRRFRRSADAPERASVIVRSLSSLSRHDEARAEARKMVRDYPNTPWTSDVHRHMFLNPPNHPEERGHGKKLELE